MKLDKKRYIAAVSGGPDSMALLDKYQDSIVGVCHVNYHKREDSSLDQLLVSIYCIEHDIPLAVYEVDKKIYAKANQHNFQALARTIRYEFFVRCSKKFKCSNLLIAHNLNDFLETATMQENRRSNNFFYGIKKENTYKNLKISRPLINIFKDDLLAYCEKHDIGYAIDSSNASDIYERNRIRKQLAKLSRKQLLALKKKYDKRNKKMAKSYTKVNKALANWSKAKYSLDYFNKFKLSSLELDSLIYLYLKINKINKINHNKIKLVRDYIVSKKSNEGLRLENNVYLVKTNKLLKLTKQVNNRKKY